MGAPIGPGDWVEHLPESETGLFRRGGLYCVSAVDPDASYCLDCSGCFGLRVVGIPNPHDVGLRGCSNWWAGCRFRPIYRPKSELIETLKTPVSIPGDVERVRQGVE